MYNKRKFKIKIGLMLEVKVKYQNMHNCVFNACRMAQKTKHENLVLQYLC